MEQKAKFEIRELLPLGMTLVIIGIGVGYGIDVTSDVRDGMCSTGAFNLSDGKCSAGGTTTTEVNATSDAILGIQKIPSKIPMIATIVVAAVIIGVLIRYLVVR